MRLHCVILLALLAAPPPSAAQAPADPSGWRLGGGVDGVRFGHVALSEAVPGVAAEIRPSPRAGAWLSAMHAGTEWRFAIELAWAGGYIEAGNDVLAVQDRTAAVSRYRIAAGLGRKVASLGVGRVEVTLAPTLDLWRVAGESRARAGAEGRIGLRVPLGSVELENRMGFGLSGNPIEAADLGDVADLRGLRVLFVGAGLWFRP